MEIHRQLQSGATGGCTRISLRDSRVIDGKSLRIKDAFTVAAIPPCIPHFVGTPGYFLVKRVIR